MDLLSYSVQYLLVYSGLNFSHLFCAFIAAARPEEASQAVSLTARNDMDVQMGHALTDFVVDGDKGSLRVHGCLHSHAQHLHRCQETSIIARRKAGQSFDVVPRNQQHMAREQRPVIEKGHAFGILEDASGLQLPLGDLAENAVTQVLKISPARRAAGAFKPSLSEAYRSGDDKL